ncbi:FAD/NAD(P)-binding protein [Streptomyces sp. NPDC005529]|uniref:FAD/NAD(P)-binding protein n=1 Tax=unclassified Streptomyces TaxID=2593676 RepID=UPI0033A9469E
MSSRSIVIVGAGPSGTSLLERLAANACERPAPTQSVVIHLIDPHPPGPGHIWQVTQSPLLTTNACADTFTIFPGENTTMANSAQPVLSFVEWAASHTASTDSFLGAELRTLRPADFPTRRSLGLYLAWVFEGARRALPHHLSLVVHATSATGLEEMPEGQQRVHLADGHAITSDAVVLAIGHLDAKPAADQRNLADYAAKNSLTYLSSISPLATGLDVLEPDEPVLVRGFGAAFFDMMALLTAGRGGRYRTERDGSLTYLQSGREPRLYVGSRRGLPYRSKICGRLPVPPPALPQFFGTPALERLYRTARHLDFDSDVRPLLTKEVGWGYQGFPRMPRPSGRGGIGFLWSRAGKGASPPGR